jgi:hypothetical protein
MQFVTALLSYQHGIHRRIFEASGLVGNVNSTVAKSDYVAPMVIKEWKRTRSGQCSIFVFCVTADLFDLTGIQTYGKIWKDDNDYEKKGSYYFTCSFLSLPSSMNTRRCMHY